MAGDVPVLQQPDGLDSITKLLQLLAPALGSGKTTTSESSSPSVSVSGKNETQTSFLSPESEKQVGDLLAKITQDVNGPDIDNMIKNILEQAKNTFGDTGAAIGANAAGVRAYSDTTLKMLRDNAMAKAIAAAAQAKLDALNKANQTAAGLVESKLQNTRSITTTGTDTKTTGPTASTKTTQTDASTLGKVASGVGIATGLNALLRKGGFLDNLLFGIKPPSNDLYEGSDYGAADDAGQGAAGPGLTPTPPASIFSSNGADASLYEGADYGIADDAGMGAAASEAASAQVSPFVGDLGIDPALLGADNILSQTALDNAIGSGATATVGDIPIAADAGATIAGTAATDIAPATVGLGGDLIDLGLNDAIGEGAIPTVGDIPIDPLAGSEYTALGDVASSAGTGITVTDIPEVAEGGAGALDGLSLISGPGFIGATFAGLLLNDIFDKGDADPVKRAAYLQSVGRTEDEEQAYQQGRIGDLINGPMGNLGIAG